MGAFKFSGTGMCGEAAISMLEISECVESAKDPTVRII